VNLPAARLRVAFISHGARVGVRVSESRLLARVRDCLPPGSKLSPTPVLDELYTLVRGTDSTYELYSGTRLLAQVAGEDAALAMLGSWLHFAVALSARPGVFVHAGVVAWRGRAVLIPGRSMSGKSTLVSALLAAGATYYSDEYAVIDADGLVHPYPKPLNLRVSLPWMAGAAFSGSPGTEPLRAGLIVITRFKHGASWRPKRVPPGRSALALLNNSVAIRTRPKAVLASVGRCALHAPAVQSPRGDAHKVARPLLTLVD